MNEIVTLLKDKFGLSEETAKSIIETIATHVKAKLPPPAQGMVDNLLAGESLDSPGGGMMDAVKGLFGGK
jgi:hypothetical protein